MATASFMPTTPGTKALNRWWRRRRYAGVHRVEERVLLAAREDGGAEVGGRAVGGEPWLRVGDLVAAVLVGQVTCQESGPVEAFHPRTDPGSPKFGRSPATTMLPSGLTAGWSMIEPSKNVQRDWPAGVTDSR